MEVRWTVADGLTRTGQVRAASGSRAGTTVNVWIDRRGHLVNRPATASEAAFRAALVGGLAGISATTVPFVGGLVLRGRLERGRMTAWDAEWARLGPQWGRMV